MSESEKPQVKIDDDWKAQAQREKEKLEQQVEGHVMPPPAPAPAEPPAPAQAPAKPPRKLPPAAFEMIVDDYARQAILLMGLMPHPATGKPQKDLEVARHFIDLLGVLEAKTKGNLSRAEEQLLTQTLYELRMTYVKVAQQG